MAELYFGEDSLVTSQSSGAHVRQEHAGFFGNIICEWDDVTGELLSTSVDVCEIGEDGSRIPTGEVLEWECPPENQCLSCSKRSENQAPEQA